MKTKYFLIPLDNNNISVLLPYLKTWDTRIKFSQGQNQGTIHTTNMTLNIHLKPWIVQWSLLSLQETTEKLQLLRLKKLKHLWYHIKILFIRQISCTTQNLMGSSLQKALTDVSIFPAFFGSVAWFQSELSTRISHLNLVEWADLKVWIKASISVDLWKFSLSQTYFCSYL